jgi:hypothetical protein
MDVVDLVFQAEEDHESARIKRIDTNEDGINFLFVEIRPIRADS